MTKTHSPPDYFQRSRRPLAMLVVLLPVILLVEMGLGGASSTEATRVLANVQLRQTLNLFAISPAFVVHALGVIVVLVLLVWHILEGDRWRIKPIDLPLMVLEGSVCAVPLLVAAAALLSTQAVPLMSGDSGPADFREAVLIACTAALSEEFIFRMCGIALGHLILVDLLRLKHAVGITISVVATAAAFTIYHDPSGLPPLAIAFYAVAGLYLGGLFAVRGFAPAVLAHAFYNMVALT